MQRWRSRISLQTPSSAPMAVLGWLAGPGVRSEEDNATIAVARGSMSEADITDIGEDFEKTNSEFQNIIAPSCRT